MIIKKELIKRQIAGDTVLIPIGKTVLDSNGLFVMNELADFIWDMLPQVETADEICEKIVEQYNVSMTEAAQDVDAFLKKLKAMGII